MPTALLLLASVLPSDNPVRALGDIAPPGPLELRGRWEGSWSREGDTDIGVTYQDGRLTLPMMPPAPMPFRMVDEGHGRFRARLGDVDVLGIYQRQDDRIVLYWRGADRGRPTRFVDEGCADVVILRPGQAGEMNRGQTLSENYTRLHPRPGTNGYNWCSRKAKTPDFPGFFAPFYFHSLTL
jgi:hypothetical protein